MPERITPFLASEKVINKCRRKDQTGIKDQNCEKTMMFGALAPKFPTQTLANLFLMLTRTRGT